MKLTEQMTFKWALSCLAFYILATIFGFRAIPRAVFSFCGSVGFDPYLFGGLLGMVCGVVALGPAVYTALAQQEGRE